MLALSAVATAACAQSETNRLLEAGYARIRARDDSGALRLFEMSFALHAGNARQYIDAAYAARRLGEHEPAYDKEALELFEAGFALHHGTARQYADAAYTASRLGEHESEYDKEALRFFEASFARQPGTSVQYVDAAYTARRLGERDPVFDKVALRLFEASFAQRSGTALQYVDAAYTARRLGTHDPAYDKKALQLFEASFAQQPGTALQYVDAAYTACRLGTHDPSYDKKALQFFAASFARQPGTALQYADAAYTARRQGESDPTYDQQALQFFEASFAQQPGTALQYVDAAYTARRIGENDPALGKEALQFFEASFARQPGTALRYADAAYTARHLGENELADQFFRSSLDANAQTPQYDAEQIYGYRREIEDAERRVGVVVSIPYQSGGFGPQETIGILQGGTEVYWQPPKIGYDDGRIFQLFARQYATLYDRSGGVTGLPTLQWSIGARYKPLSSQNLMLTVEKLMTGGRYAYDDWLFRIGYSVDDGLDLHPVKPDWQTWQFYTESAYFVNQARLIQPVELRYGHSWRLGSISDHLVLFPHAVIAGDFDSRAQQRLALGIGPGVGLRYWFRESVYRAPASWLDLNIQYRLHLTDADRAKGLVIRTTLWF
ncbi:bacteriophage N4 adsorption protein A [Burkholderia aenigmatica]|uniref:bacteriophage N4 adsorption protein A n=1 Tax=Burkholderia aenigmatica TaxID=2015348 RepID=UPI0020C6A716|nr:bacteriophage N4 adsorption protein A [Burkholderia aenigmatica]